MAKEFAWSYSALTRFENCGKQYYEINVAKNVKDEGNEFTAAGQEVHAALYQRICKDKKLPLNMRHYEKMAARLAAQPGENTGELKFAMTRAFEPTDYFSQDVFVRVIVDLLNVRDSSAVIVDFKTGKQQPGFDQLLLTAGVVSSHLPEIENFKLAYLWLKNKTITSTEISKSSMISVWNMFLPRVAKMEAAVKTATYVMKPSGLCRFCPVESCVNWKPRD